MAEIRFGIESCPEPSFREELTTWLDTVLRPWFTDRILGIDEDVILIWRQIVEKGRKQNHTFSQPDLFIAATAIKHDLCIATRNETDFKKAGVAVFSPWQFSFNPV